MSSHIPLLSALGHQLGFDPLRLLREHACTLTLDDGTALVLRWQAAAALSSDGLHIAVRLGHLRPGTRQGAMVAALLANTEGAQQAGTALALDPVTQDAWLCMGLGLAGLEAPALADAVAAAVQHGRVARQAWSDLGWLAD